MSTILIFFIRCYQRTLSPDHGYFAAYFPYGFCRFTPSCSQYMLEALQTHRTKNGLILAIKRIIRCNPFTRGGHDPVI